MMAQQETGGSSLSGEVRFSVPLPIVLPLVIVVVIGGLAVAFAQIMLNVSKDIAVALAMLTAVNILGACTFVALRKRTSPVVLGELFLVSIYPIFIGAVIAFVGVEATTAETTPEGAGHAPDAGIELVAQNIAFQQDEITVTAGEQLPVLLDNQDSVQHNWAVYETIEQAEAQESALFDGAIIEGGTDITYQFEAPPPGEYVFQCDLHPVSMRGTLISETGDGGGGEGAGEGEGVDVEGEPEVEEEPVEEEQAEDVG